MSLSSLTERAYATVSAFLAAAMAATVGTALAFEHIGGYLPCKLCLEQRVPYYIGVPVMVLATLSAVFRLPTAVTRLLILIGGALMLWTMYLSGYHSGVEWGWWEGPADCSTPVLPTIEGSLLDQLNAVIPPSCGVASWRFLGLSFAGWNFVISTILAAVAFTAVLRKRG
ncbi:disulfide bond formation protein B [Chelativorans composti]|jgi:Disulfide bond formation protein DsbB|uniref:Disulfide bond formation protein B n=1 Tax=Chelativorans composti TaxID=768533 RepID=A0ABW5DHE9_9HYPH